MKVPTSVLALSLMLSACKHAERAQNWPDDSEIRQWIVGTWTPESPTTNSLVTFSAGGSFDSTSTNKLVTHGTWRIFRPDASVICVSADGFEPALYTVRHVSAHELVLLQPYASGPPQKPLRFTR